MEPRPRLIRGVRLACDASELMMSPISRADVANRIRELVQRPLRDTEDLFVWRRAADDLQLWLKEQAAADLIPHSIWHYLADADVRLRDREYARRQEAEVEYALAAMCD